MNYRGPGGDRTHDLQTEATPPAASCPARTLHATEIAPKNATPMTCPWLHWTTDNPSGMHWCQFQHLCVLILNCALALAIYIFVGLILMLWHRETHINPQRNRWIIVDPAGIELTTSRLRQLRQLPVVQHVRFTPLKSRLKTQLQWHAGGCTGQLTTRLECTGVNFNTCVHTYIHFYSGICTGTGNIFIGEFCMNMLRWFWESTPKWLSFKIRLAFWLQLTYWYDQMRNKDWHFRVAWPGDELSTSRVTGRCLIHYTTSDSVNYDGFTRTLSSVNIKSTNFEEKIIPGI